MGNEKRCGVRAMSHQFCATQLVACCRKDEDLFWATFLELLGKYPGLAKRLEEEEEKTGYRKAGVFWV